MNAFKRLWQSFLKNLDVYLIIGGGFAGAVVAFLQGLQGQVNNLYISSLTLSILGFLAISLLRDRQSSKKDQSFQIFEEQHDAYRFLIDVINQYGARKAILFQYSSTMSLSVVRVLLSKGAQVTVFVQHEDTATQIGSQLQADRIKTTTRGILSELRRTPQKLDKLKIYKFRTPGTVSAVKIDDRLLCMGWYTYERVAPTDQEHYGDDTVAVSGHDVATLIAWQGSREFTVLDKMFTKLEENYRNNAEEMPL